MSVARCLCIQLSELGHREQNKITQNSKRQQRRFERGLPRFGIQHSISELPHSTSSGSDWCILLGPFIISALGFLIPADLGERKKGMFLYSAVSRSLDRSKCFTLFLPWQTCSFRHQLGLSGKHSSHAAITAQRLSTHTSAATVCSQELMYTAE